MARRLGQSNIRCAPLRCSLLSAYVCMHKVFYANFFLSEVKFMCAGHSGTVSNGKMRTKMLG